MEEAGARHEVHQHQQAERRQQQAPSGVEAVCRNINYSSFAIPWDASIALIMVDVDCRYVLILYLLSRRVLQNGF